MKIRPFEIKICFKYLNKQLNANRLQKKLLLYLRLDVFPQLFFKYMNKIVL